MTSNDLIEIESSLGIKIPEAYAVIVCSEEMRLKYEEGEFESGLLFDRERIEDENIGYREIPVARDYWNPSWFVIHVDGGGNAYFITTDPYDERVYGFDHEQTFPGYDATDSPAFCGLSEFLVYLDSEKRWEEESLRRNKKPSMMKLFLEWFSNNMKKG